MVEQELAYGGLWLKDSRPLASYGIRAEATLQLVTRLRGGKPVPVNPSPAPRSRN